MRKRKLAGILCLAFLAAPGAPAQQITIAAAADLQFALQDTATRFQKQTGKAAKLTYGS